MAQEDITMGPDAALVIENETFVWTGGSVTLQYKEHDTNDSSDAVNDQFRRGRRRLMIEGNFQSDNTRNVHAGPYNLGATDTEFVDVKVYPDGLSYDFFHAATWLASSIRFDMPVKAGDPVTGTISGGSSGTITLPGE